MTLRSTAILFGLVAVAPVDFAQRAPIVQQLTFAPFHASGIYDIGETVGWTVTPGPVTPTYSYKWTIRGNNAVVLKEGKLDLSSGKDTIEITGDQAEMIYVAIEPYATLDKAAPAPESASASTTAAPTYLGGNTGRDTGLYAVGAAVAPAKIGLSTPRPDCARVNFVENSEVLGWQLFVAGSNIELCRTDAKCARRNCLANKVEAR